jgi:hypothetical protein
MADRRAVGGPVARSLLAAYIGSALAAWLAAAVAMIAAADDFAAGNPLATAPVLAVHLVALGALPLAVSGASFHILPVMLRNDLPSQRLLWLALPLLGGGLLVAPGVATGSGGLVWVGAALLAAGLAIVLAEILALVVRAPRGRLLVASRVGVALSCAHVVAALVAGTVTFEHGGVEWLLVHLHLGLIGWIALLVVTVGRNLGPMLAQAPAAPRRSWPVEELALVAGLWVLLAGIALRERALTLAGGVIVVVAAASFGTLMLRVLRTRRAPIEAPLAHLVVGNAFLVQAAAAGLAVAAGAGGMRLLVAYVVLLLLGWAGGVVIGHAGKLLSLSLWVWWPPGPRPKQSALYPRRLGVVEAAVFALAVETLAIGNVAGTTAVARVGAVLLAMSAALAAGGAAVTWARRSRGS